MIIFSRRIHFFFIEKVLLPLFYIPIRIWMATWKTRIVDPLDVNQCLNAPRLVIATFHGMLLHLIAFAGLVRRRGRRIVVMTSPSYDGRLLGAFLGRFGIDHVLGSSRSRSVGGSLEFIDRVKAGDIGLIAVDGPRGPCCDVKPGFLRIAVAARAHLLVAATSAKCGITLNSWDRAHLPVPFGIIQFSAQLTPPVEARDQEQALAAIKKALFELSRQISSSVLPPALRRYP